MPLFSCRRTSPLRSRCYGALSVFPSSGLSLPAHRMLICSIVFLVPRLSFWLCIGLSSLCVGSCLSPSYSRFPRSQFTLPHHSSPLCSRVTVACDRQVPTASGLFKTIRSLHPSVVYSNSRWITRCCRSHCMYCLGFTSLATHNCNAGRLTATFYPLKQHMN